MVLDYAEFLASKRQLPPTTGVACDPSDVHPFLHPWQAEIVAWAVRQGRAGLFTTTGTGKTVMELEYARLSGATSLTLAPLAVCQQTIREAAQKLDLEVRYVRDGSQIEPGGGLYISNYEMAGRFDPRDLDAVVLDEGCFPAGTPVDTPTGPAPIEQLRPGDQICNAAGTDTVAAIATTEIPYAVRVTVAGRSIISSATHPFATQRGWVSAQDLEPGDSVLVAEAALRMVRGGDRAQGQARPVLQPVVLGEVADGPAGRPGESCPEGRPAQAAEELRVVRRDVLARPGRHVPEVLRAILLSEMANDPTRNQGEGPQPSRRSEAGRPEAGLVCGGFAGGVAGAGTCADDEPHRERRRSGEDLPSVEGQRPRTFRAWGQWPWLDRATATSAGCTWSDLGGGVRCVSGPADSWVSHALQARRGASRAASRYRAGWSLPPQPTRAGCEEGREAGFARVDGLEVLEPGDPRLAGCRDADGKLRFYDLQSTRHPSYSVDGLLVHNSILRDSTGKTRNLLVDLFADVPHRMSGTATPRPNDAEELTNQAAFLGVMSRVDMLAAFFIHDDDGWHVKGHAREPMFRWMARWAWALRRPSDMGHPDDGYDLPGLDVIPELLPVDIDSQDQLFATDLGGVGGRAQVRRRTLRARCERAAELRAADPHEPWLLWCGLNAEADLLADLIPGAVNVHGAMSPEEKAEALLGFADGHFSTLITKPAIASRGLNYQRCAHMAFIGLSDSYEDYFQAIRRCHRYGQTRRVRAHIVLSELEGQIAANVARKEREADLFMAELVTAMQRARSEELTAA